MKELRPVWAFLCLSAILTWTIWLWPIDERLHFYLRFFGWQLDWPLNNLTLVVGNCLPGALALVWAGFQGRQQFRELVSSLFAWRAKPKWYLLAVGLPCGIFVATLCAILLILPARISQPPISVLVLGLVSMFMGPLWEEIAWRAFAFRRLQTRYSAFVSSLIIGVFWAVWHVPMWALTLNYLTIPLLLIICLNVVAWSVVFAFLYIESGQSLPVVIVLHGTYLIAQNELTGWLGYGQLTLPKDVAKELLYGPQYVIVIAMVLSVCLAVFLGRRLRRVPRLEHAAK
jgi:membrane protease YdiL (CAAX protease family)